MNKRRKQDLMVILLAVSSAMIFIYLNKLFGSFMIIASLIIGMCKRDVYNYIFENKGDK